MLPVVAIVGRPNVGKSSLFNRLVGKRRAIESEFSGTTRDQISERIELLDFKLILVDTGGVERDAGGDLESDIQAQAKTAIQGADLVLFVLDVRYDPTADDFHASELLRKSGKPCIMVANKCDHLSHLEERTYNFYELGFGEPVAASAIHGTGMDELQSRIVDGLKDAGFAVLVEAPVMDEEALRITFVGRPNVGKSSLVNALFGKEKVIVSEVPGTTRDAIEIPFEYSNHPFVLVDTAGMRRRGKVEKGIEKYSVLRSFQAIEDSDVVVLVIDGNEGLKAQDLHVCEFVLNQHKGLIVVVNKIDLFDDFETDRRRFEHLLRARMAFVPWAPVVFASAKARRNLFSILDVALGISEQRHRQVDPSELNFWFDEVVQKHSSAGSRGRRQAGLQSVKQTAIDPPCFVFKTKNPQLLHFSYRRYLENQLRERFGFTGTAVRMIFDR